MIYLEPFVTLPGPDGKPCPQTEPPFPSTSEIVSHLLRAEEWNIFETLLWIAKRDEQVVAETIRQWRDERPEFFHRNQSVHWIAHLRRSFSDRPWPDEQLATSLLRGEVLARGRLNGTPGRAAIPQLDWVDLVLDHGDAFEEGQVSAVYQPLKLSGPRWTRVLFESGGLKTAFLPISRRVQLTDLTIERINAILTTMSKVTLFGVAKEVIREIECADAASDESRIRSVAQLLRDNGWPLHYLQELQAKVRLHPNLQSGLQP